MKHHFSFITLLCAYSFIAITGEHVAPNVKFSEVMELPHTLANEKISYGEDDLQYGLLWRGLNKPAGQQQPLVVLIHGGCWLSAYGIDHALPMASALAAAGLDVWALEYRRSGDLGGGWPGSLADIQTALAYVPQLPQDINKSQLILVGHSAGGHLALLAQAMHPKTNHAQIIKTIGLAAITDITAYAQGNNSCQTAGPIFMGGTPAEKPKAYYAANPQHYAPYTYTLLLQGQADVIVPETQAQLAGAEIIKLATAGHFDWIHPNSEAFELLLNQLQSIVLVH